MSGPSNDQREYSRYPVAENLYCYIDGNRFDARSLDISAGGLFIRTPKKVPIGAHIALVFKDKDAPDTAPVFLVGKVMRHQEDDVSGIGLQWDRAISEGSSAQLELFLTLRMGVIPGVIRSEASGPRQETRHVFDFADRGEETKGTSPEDMMEAPAALKSGPGPLPRPKLRTVEPVHVVKSDGKVEDLELVPLPEHVVRLSDGAPGPLSCILQRGESLAPVTLDATVEIKGRSLPVTIRGMSVKTMFITGLKGPTTKTRPFQVRFRLPAKADWTTILCTCRVLFVDTGDAMGMKGLELEIEHYDEGDSKGILWTYLKWVTFRQIRGQES
jgi:hypothetical protein